MTLGSSGARVVLGERITSIFRRERGADWHCPATGGRVRSVCRSRSVGSQRPSREPVDIVTPPLYSVCQAVRRFGSPRCNGPTIAGARYGPRLISTAIHGQRCL